MQIISRAEASAFGLKTYFTGVACKNGHIAERSVKTFRCVECHREFNSTRYYKNTKKILSQAHQRYEDNPSRYIERAKDWNKKNLRRVKENQQRWFKDNPEKARFYSSHRRASQLKATPQWADKEALQVVYANCPEGMVIDHVVPLKGKNVCGLHVPWNLQYLSRVENSTKGNRCYECQA